MDNKLIEQARMRLMAYPEAKIVLEAALEKRPSLRGMKPGKPLNEQAEQMLFESGMRLGFDKLMTFLRGNSEWQNRLK